jgi:hypothetical protein
MDAVDLQQYFPDYAVHEYRKASGASYARYTFQKSPSGIDNLYYGYMNLNKAGSPYMWRKEYWKADKWCTETYMAGFFGDDGSITETGDWMPSSTPCTPNTMLGYRKADGSNTGLVWAPAGGLSDIPEIAEMNVVRQNTPGAAVTLSGTSAYSKTGLIKVLEYHTPPYGRCVDGTWGAGCGKTYYDVVHIVMYHGTKKTVPAPVRCVGAISANGAYYQSHKDYNSYAIELYLAKGIGIIQENTPFIEDASFWGMQNCTGDFFQWPGQWPSYIDQP